MGYLVHAHNIPHLKIAGGELFDQGGLRSQWIASVESYRGRYGCARPASW